MYTKLPTMYIGHVWIGHCASTTINAQKSDKEGEEAEMWLQAMNSLVLQNKLMVKSSMVKCQCYTLLALAIHYTFLCRDLLQCNSMGACM